MAYTWIPFYKEFAQKLLQFRSYRKPLVDWDVSNLVPDISCMYCGTEVRQRSILYQPYHKRIN